MAPSIAQERAQLADVNGAPSLRRREQWGARHDYTRARTVSDGPATRVFIHISVTNPGNYNSNDAHARAIEAIGRARFGTKRRNTGISYNRGVMPNSQVYEMQPMGRRGAHTVNNYGISTCTRSGSGHPGRGQSLTAPSGNLNYNARAYVICQNVGDPVTDEQIDQLARQIVADYEAGLITRHAAHHPHGHRCVSAKSCPGNRMWARMGDLHDRIHHYLDHGLGDDDMPEKVTAPNGEEWSRRHAFEWMMSRLSELRWGKIVTTPNGSKWTPWHALSWIMRRLKEFRSQISEILDVGRANGAKLDALMDAQTGLDTDAIKAHIDERYQAAASERAELAEALGTATDTLDSLTELVEQGAAGEITPDEMVEAFKRVLREGVTEDDTD